MNNDQIEAIAKGEYLFKTNRRHTWTTLPKHSRTQRMNRVRRMLGFAKDELRTPELTLDNILHQATSMDERKFARRVPDILVVNPDECVSQLKVDCDIRHNLYRPPHVIPNSNIIYDYAYMIRVGKFELRVYNDSGVSNWYVGCLKGSKYDKK